MKTRKTAKFVVLSSVICLILCCTLAIGSTFAWFTDSVVSGTNIIKSGILDIEMFYKEPADAEDAWKDASQGTIFNYQLWEPGYVDVKQVKIANVGNLALQYDLLLTVEGGPEDVKLAEVIDVYIGEELPADRTLNDMFYVGTLRDLIGGGNYESAASGILLPEDGKGSTNFTTLAEAANAPEGSVSYTIALKMQESAGNEYQNLQIGLNGVKVMLNATQYTWENDAFDNMYDNMSQPSGDATTGPKASITELDVPAQSMYIARDILNNGFSGADMLIEPEAAFTFQAEDTAESVKNSPYKEWLVDYYVSIQDGKSESTADNDYNGLILVGSYGNWEDGAWYGFKVPNNVTANTDIDYSEPIGLLGVMTGGVSNWTYTSIVNGVNTFNCGYVNYSDANVGDVMTVQLCLINPDNTNERIVVAEFVRTIGLSTEPVANP